jgi:hypothetical protein
MPVRKFRSLDEAARSLWREPGDPRIWDGVIRRWNPNPNKLTASPLPPYQSRHRPCVEGFCTAARLCGM